jgi:hypothetical protein
MSAEVLPFRVPPQRRRMAYTVLKIFRKGASGTPGVQYFVETKEGVTLFTTDEQLLPALQAAAYDGVPREIVTKRVLVGTQRYLQIVEFAAGGRTSGGTR